ncbi:hypothetical protein [Alcanivorax sediminis]|uniref:Uncharacterized protein n=1 Tax=Alcanivorax sediminis TaxID=2663008 RepID=A0A6N7LSM3_9GAMM|nr:hypothetical protein [Alcanivorax sediminis]MQX52025.1 hypothetical protein [Alcanivorax sediminis]
MSLIPQELIEEIDATFTYWYEDGQEIGMEQYSKENCDKARSIVLNLVRVLEEDSLTHKEIIQAFESSVVSMNSLSDQVPSLIETGERETLCELYDEIAKAVGLDPLKYGGGDGVASEWRTW